MSVKWKGTNLVPYNYGDDLNVFILEHLTKKRIFKHSSFFHFSKINFLCIGSIIEFYCNKHSVIWGSGSMYGNTSKVYKPKKVCALRGVLSKRYLESYGVNCPDVYGDPALLLPLIYKPTNVNKKYKLGIIPHYVDYNLPHVIKFREEHPEVLFINMQEYSGWFEIIDKINSCENIASSSLHGMIISDAYEVPNVQIVLSDKITGGDFKYRDYCTGVHRKYKLPVDCQSGININQILDSMAEYRKIKFDAYSLLKACPLPIDNEVLIKWGGVSNGRVIRLSVAVSESYYMVA